MDFAFSEEQAAIRETARRFAEDRLAGPSVGEASSTNNMLRNPFFTASMLKTIKVEGQTSSLSSLRTNDFVMPTSAMAATNQSP